MKLKHLEIKNYGEETVDFYSKPTWHCILSDDDGNEREVSLGLVVQTLDMLEVCGECSNESYPVNLEIGIMVSNPDRYFVDDSGDFRDDEQPSQAHLIDACLSYMGTVPVTHTFLSTDASNKKLLDKLSLKVACLETVKPNFGTVAAQMGPGTAFTFPSFKSNDDAAKFGEKLVKEYGDILMGMMVGFILDRPINMIGETGWTSIEKMVEYKR